MRSALKLLNASLVRPLCHHRMKVLKEVALLLHDAVELVEVDLAITILVGLVDHVLKLLVIDSLSELLSHGARLRKEILLVESSSNMANTLTTSSRESFSPILPVIMPMNSLNSTLPLPS